MTARVLPLTMCAFTLALLARSGGAQELLPSHGIGADRLGEYRTFQLKSTLRTVAALAGVDPAAAKTLHDRPALLQDLEWRPSRWVAGSMTDSMDPVEQIVFSFYNDQLFQLAIDYARDRTEGMTDGDMTGAISDIYGSPVKRLPGIMRLPSRLESESGQPIARWGDADHALVLYRSSSYGDTFRLIVTDRPLENAARKAEAQGQRLDDQDAPSRDAARQQKEEADRRAKEAKSRVANKKAFRP